MIKYLVNGFEYKVYQVEVESETETSVILCGEESKKRSYDGLNYFDSIEEARLFLIARYKLEVETYEFSIAEFEKKMLASKSLYKKAISNEPEVVRL